MNRDEILEAIKNTAEALGHPPSRAEFKAQSGLTEHRVLKHFPTWTDAVRAAGLQPNLSHVRIDDEALLKDWAEVVRRCRRIPTMAEYRHGGRVYSADVFKKHFGPWSGIPDKFREHFHTNPEYTDVLALLPGPAIQSAKGTADVQTNSSLDRGGSDPTLKNRHSKLDHRPTYGNPLRFRGLRHEPTNEQGVVFLFGTVAYEMGYLVEAVQEGFPDCEAKRKIGPGKWQRVRIEFEYESRSFRDHGHPPDGCDIIVCWRHNWSECPPHLEVVELSSRIKSLPTSEDWAGRSRVTAGQGT